jgi:hypothetical protein
LLRMVPPQGLHLLSIPLSPEVIGTYVPTWLSAAEYPGLVPTGAPIDTVAVGTGLFVGSVAADSDDYHRIAAVVDAFFTRFPTLLTPGHHAKWAEVNLSSEIPGWHRFPFADDWLKRNASSVAGPDLKTAFLRFLDERDKAVGHGQMSQEQRDALFDQFRRWQNTVAQSTQTPGTKPH